jgi:hypothetical protein
MNDRAWSETVPDLPQGIRIGLVEKPVRLPRRRRLLVAAVVAIGALFGIARAAWRGDLPLWMATLVLATVCGAVNPVWSIVESSVPSGGSGTVELAVLIGWAATLWAALAWALVVFWRSLAASRAGGGSALVAVAMLVAMGYIGMNAWSSARQMSCYSESLWREVTAPHEARGRHSRALLEYDEASRTLWVRGALEFGAAEEFRKALRAYPAARTIGLDSPGGYVAEARRMADAILQRRLDTYAHDLCASACIDLFAAGQRRWAGQHTVFGFHRSGHECSPDSGFNQSDLVAANFLRERGVAEEFIQHAFETPYTSIWKPDVRTVIDGGLVTGLR